MTGTSPPGTSSRLEVDVFAAAGDFAVTAAFSAATGITVLFGPSGSGKSVTLDTVAGLLRPTTGTIRIDDELWADPERGVHVPTQQRRLGMVFQHAALLAHRSPLDNVALGVRTGTRGERRSIAQRWLDRVRAGHLTTSPTMGLSGGEQQRVALARALAGDPRLLLLDEPFSALDQPTRQALRSLLRELVAEEGITALVVTHDLDDVLALADHVVVYEPGRTVATHELHPGGAHELAALLGLVPRGTDPSGGVNSRRSPTAHRGEASAGVAPSAPASDR